ncbi:hypothetical protein ECZU26_08690 [Escherichia coli]|nr:hypothetical protein ECZU26_08690 [Escherichia coli]
MTTLTLVLTAVGSVLLLLFLVMKARMHAFLALMVVSMGAGLFSGMPLDKIAATMEKGMGGTLGFLAVVVALGAMFGKILHETGAVDQIAVKMLKSFGHSRAHYAIGLAGLVCALPLFFEVAIVLLISVAFSMARHTGTNPVKLVIPLFAGVAAAAAFWCWTSANAAGIADECRLWLDDPDWPVCGNSGNDYCRAAVG